MLIRWKSKDKSSSNSSSSSSKKKRKGREGGKINFIFRCREENFFAVFFHILLVVFVLLSNHSHSVCSCSFERH